MNGRLSFGDYLKATGEVGYVQRVLHSVVEVEGLPGAAISEMVKFEQGQWGQITALSQEGVEVLVLSREPVNVGKRVARTGSALVVPVGEWCLGGTLDAMGREVGGGGRMGKAEGAEASQRIVDAVPLGIVGRKKISRQLVTGLAMVDMMVPVGMGQRELVMGDRKTGKTFLLWQLIVAQARAGSVCIYTAIGKKRTEIIKLGEFFSQMGITQSTVIVATVSDDSAGEIWLCPYIAMTIAEYFRDQGRDVVLVLDDMSTHAKFYRELSLVAKKFPGRDSYPGDIFHIHSKLLERGGNFEVRVSDSAKGSVETKEAAITVLPVVDTVQGDVTGYIQTNLMSMTDGHIYFDSDLFFKGRRPAINPFVSVTRVGSQTQSGLAKDASRVLFDLLANYEKTQGFLRFGAELGENSRQILAMGDKVLAFFDQPAYTAVGVNLQLVGLAMLVAGLWDGKNISQMVEAYTNQPEYTRAVDGAVEASGNFGQLMERARNVSRVLSSI